jgi:T5SS/PEP-CTERM-associated repeat protein
VVAGNDESISVHDVPLLPETLSVDFLGGHAELTSLADVVSESGIFNGASAAGAIIGGSEFCPPDLGGFCFPVAGFAQTEIRFEVIESPVHLLLNTQLTTLITNSEAQGSIASASVHLSSQQQSQIFHVEACTPCGLPAAISETFETELGIGLYFLNVTGFKSNEATTNWNFNLLLGDMRWVDPVDGNFSDGAKWSAGRPPAADESALITETGSYTITLDQNVTHRTLNAHGSGVNAAIDLAGNTYTLDEISLGGFGGDSGTMTFADSGGIVSVAAAAAAAADEFPAVTASTLNPADARLVTALLRADKGFKLNLVDVPTLTDDVQIKDDGQVLVKGNGRLYVNDAAVIDGEEPGAGQYHLIVENGGQFGNNTGASVVLAPEFASVAEVRIKDDGSFWRTQSLTVAKKGDARQFVDDGAALHANEIVIGAEMGSSGILDIHRGHVEGGDVVLGAESGSFGALSVSGGGSFTQTDPQGMSVGKAGNGSLSIDGQGTKVVLRALSLGVESSGRGEVSITNGGELMIASQLRAGVDGTANVVVNGGKLVREGTAVSTGQSIIQVGSEVDVQSGQFVERRLLTVNGKLRIEPGMGEVGVGPFANPLPGLVVVDAGGTLAGNGTIIGGAAALNGGVIQFPQSHIFPGNSPGTLTIDGNFEQVGGVLGIEIAGTGPGQFDVLKVTGDVSLAGELLLHFIEGFAPRQGDEFMFLDVDGALAGAFANIEVRGLLPGFQFDLRPGAGGLAMVALNDGVSVPEPASVAILLVGMLGGLIRQRRSHRAGQAQ